MHRKHRSLADRDPLARFHALQTRRHLRDSTSRFCIEGIRQFLWACDAGLTFDMIFHSRVLLQSSAVRKRIAHVESLGVRRVSLGPEQFRGISTTEHASGIAAIVRQHWSSLERIDPRAGTCWLIVESIRSPGNLGTILRTAEAVGAGGMIFLGPLVDPFDPRVVRASMGGIFQLKLVRTTPHELARWSHGNGMRIVGLDPHASTPWTDLPGEASPIALMLGEERSGLSAAAKSLCNTNVRLPMIGRADSLNVAVAAGVMMYEILRRRPVGNARS